MHWRLRRISVCNHKFRSPLILTVFSGEFLVQNYHQALRIIGGEDELEKKMKQRGIVDRHTFEQWLEEEWQYLKGLSQEPVEETTVMEYYQALVDLKASQ